MLSVLSAFLVGHQTQAKNASRVSWISTTAFSPTSLFTSFNGDCSDQIAFYFYMRMPWNVLAIGRVSLEAMAYEAETAFETSVANFDVEKMVAAKLYL